MKYIYIYIYNKAIFRNEIVKYSFPKIYYAMGILESDMAANKN